MSLGNGYILNANLDDAYIQELITRCGFTDVTQPGSYWSYAIMDQDGITSNMGSINGARDWLIQKWLIQQNS